jgi:PAS domain S-box-containing protein
MDTPSFSEQYQQLVAANLQNHQNSSAATPAWALATGLGGWSGVGKLTESFVLTILDECKEMCRNGSLNHLESIGYFATCRRTYLVVTVAATHIDYMLCVLHVVISDLVYSTTYAYFLLPNDLHAFCLTTAPCGPPQFQALSLQQHHHHHQPKPQQPQQQQQQHNYTARGAPHSQQQQQHQRAGPYSDMQHVYDHMAMSAASTSAASSLGGFGGSELSAGTSKKDRGRSSREARNTREQRRAHKISNLIDQLKEMLDQAQFSTKSASKLHTLSGCEDYIRSVRQKLHDGSSCSGSTSPVPQHFSSGMLGGSGEDGSSGNGSDNDSNSGSNSGSSNTCSSSARRSGSSDGGSTSNDNNDSDDVGRGSTQSPTSTDGSAAGTSTAAAPLNFRDWFRLNPMAMCVASASGNVVDANDRFLKAMGMSSQQAMGTSVITLISPEHIQSVLLPLSRMLGGAADAAARAPITVPAARAGQLLTLSTVLSPAGHVVCLHLVLLPAPEHCSGSSGAAAAQRLQ